MSGQLAFDLPGLEERGAVEVDSHKHSQDWPDHTLVNVKTAGLVRSEWVPNALLSGYVEKLRRQGFRVEVF